MNIGSKTLASEISNVVQNAMDDGRNHLNDDEANHLIKISQKLVQDYVKELENLEWINFLLFDFLIQTNIASNENLNLKNSREK